MFTQDSLKMLKKKMVKKKTYVVNTICFGSGCWYSVKPLLGILLILDTFVRDSLH